MSHLVRCCEFCDKAEIFGKRPAIAGRLLLERRTAVEAGTALSVHEDRPDCREAGALTAEQEFVQIRGLAEDVHVLPAHKPHPLFPHQIGDQYVKLSEAVCDPKP